MSSQWKELILNIDGLFQKHNSQSVASDSLHITGDILSRTQIINYMKTLVDVISLPNLRNSTDFSKMLGITFERLFILCSDECDDVRIFSEECLNRLTHNLEMTDLPRILRQIHFELRRNGPYRSLRSALRRHAQVCEHVNPQFLRLFCQDLIPLLLLISNRDEELIMEELMDSFGKISIRLTRYFTQRNIFDLLGTWINLLAMNSPTKRRVGANILISLVINCQNSAYYISLLLKEILGLVPKGNGKCSNVLGVLLCLRYLAPYLGNNLTENHSSSFSDDSADTDIKGALNTFYFQNILQAFVFVVHYTTCSHNNIVNASLDTLSVMLTNPHSKLVYWLIQCNHPIIFLPILHSIEMDSDLNLCESFSESSNLAQFRDVTADNFESELCVDNPDLSDYITQSTQQSTEISCGIDSVSSSDSYDSSSDDEDLRLGHVDVSAFPESMSGSILTQNDSTFHFDSASEFHNFDLNVPCVLDDDVAMLESSLCLEFDLIPLTRIIRRLCIAHLLSGISGSLLSDGTSHISIQNSAINCLSTALRLKPELLLIPLFPLNSLRIYDSNPQYISDIFLFFSHPDPFTIEKILMLSSSFIKYQILNSNSCSLSFICKFDFRYMLTFLLDCFIQMLMSPDGIHAKATCIALKNCIPELLKSCYGALALHTISHFLFTRHYSFWLARIEFCNLLAVIDWKYVAILERGFIDSPNFQLCRLQRYVASNILPWLLMDDDPRVWNSFRNVLKSFIEFFYTPNDSFFIFDSFEYFSSLLISEKRLNPCYELQINLHYLIGIVTNSLIKFESIKNVIATIDSLVFIAENYSPSKFPNSWGISFNKQEIICKSKFTLCSYGILPFLYNHLSKFDIISDFRAHSNFLFLTVSLLKAGIEILLDYDRSFGNPSTSFQLSDRNISMYCSELFKHLVRVLRMLDIIISRKNFNFAKRKLKSLGLFDEHSVKDKYFPNEKNIWKQNVFKSHKADSTQSKLEHKTKVTLGTFSQNNNYVRLFHILKKSYFGYQHSINLNKIDRFCCFVKVILDTFCDLISCSLAFDLFPHTEEILSYLFSTFKIHPSPTLLLIEQYISVMYGWNRDLAVSSSTETFSSMTPITLHDILYFIPLNLFQKELFQYNKVDKSIKFHSTFPKYPKVDYSKVLTSKTNTKFLSKKADKNLIQKFKFFPKKMDPISEKQKTFVSSTSQPPISNSFKQQIKLFEGILTFSLNIYSSTSCLTKNNIITLVTKLVMFQLNYSLIDSNSILLNKIFNQVGYIEQGFAFETPIQISVIFQFLVVISVYKPDTLPFSKIVLLCESAISSRITTSSISVVKPLVIYIYPEAFQLNQNLEDYLRDFLQFCQNIKHAEHGDKDIIFNILIRLIQYPDCISILANILKSVQNCEVKWADTSLLIIGPLLQKIKRNQVEIDNFTVFGILQDLIFNLHPSSANRISLFFFALHSTVELHSITSLLSWIAVGLLVTKLSCKCYDEHALFTEIHEIYIIFPKVKIDFIFVADSMQIGPNLSPQELIVQVIKHLSERSITLLDALKYLSRTCLNLESPMRLLWNIISQLFTLILWVLKDNTFKRISSRVNMYIDQIITLYLANSRCEENSIFYLQRMKNHYPILFLKLLHLCGFGASSSYTFWNVVIESMKNSLELCQNPLHQYIFRAIIFEILILTILQPTKYPLKLLSKENLVPLMLAFMPELSVFSFLYILRSSEELFAIVCDQLKSYFASEHSSFHMKELLILLEYLNFAFDEDYIFSENFLNSRNQALVVTFLNGLFGKYKSNYSLENNQGSEVQDFDHLLSCTGIRSQDLSKYCDILKININSADDIPGVSNIFESEGNSLKYYNEGDPFHNWFIFKITEFDISSDFFTMDFLKPIRCLNFENLSSMFNRTGLDFHFLYFVIQSSKETIIDSIRLVHHNELIDEDNNTVVTSLTKILQHCSILLFSMVDNYIYHSNGSNIEFILNATRCLVALFDSGLYVPKFVDFDRINLHNVLRFGFMHLENICTKPFLMTKIDSLIPALLCPSFILATSNFEPLFKEYHRLIFSGINLLFDLLTELLGIYAVNNIKRKFLRLFFRDEVIGKLNVLLTLLPTHITEEFIPSDLISPIRKLVISLCNLDGFYFNLIIPFNDWNGTYENTKSFDSFPQFSVDVFHDPEIFFEMMKRIATLGWKSKDQFEEIWSLIIKVLVPSNHDESLGQEELMEIMKTSCIAVETVTTHLLTYLLHPLPGVRNPCYGLDLNDCGDSSAQFFYSRDGLLLNGERRVSSSKLHTKPLEKVYYLKTILEAALRQAMQFRKVPSFGDDYYRSIDRAFDYVGYLPVQFSCPPLVFHNESELYSECTRFQHHLLHFSMVKGWLGVNLNSCVRLLYDLYNNWVLGELSSVPLMLYHSTVKSLLFLSDLFTDESQILWLLEFCLDLYRSHPIDDEIMKVYIILAVFKAGSIIHKNSQHISGILDVLDYGLLALSPSINISIIEGLIFLFQEEDCSYLSPAISKVTNFILRQMESSHPIMLYFHQQHILDLVSVGTTLIIHHSYLLKDQDFSLGFVDLLISYCSLPEKNRNWNVLYSILSAFELLIIRLSLQQAEKAAILNLTLRLLTDGICSSISFCALSLLVTCMYIGDSRDTLFANNHFENLTLLEIDPMTHNIDLITQTRDKITLLLNVIRISGFLEARFTAQILQHILIDLLPSNQSMNTIVAEFIDLNQPNVALIGWLLYKLFQMLYQRGQDKEVKLWALLCLSSFIQRQPIEHSIWNLSCLFVSTSKDPNIFNLLPFVLSRLLKLNKWDEDIFLTAGTSFYQILEQEEKGQFTSCLHQYIDVHPLFLRLLCIVKTL